MAYSIIESCVNCWACQPLCPSDAIHLSQTHFMIDSKKCTECDGDFIDAQCASICPIEGAILNSYAVAANLPGSLTGIPPERLSEVMAEIQAR